VRPDLRIDMAGIPEISGPQEREMWCTQRERLHHRDPQSLVENPVPRPSARILRKSERDQGSACEEDSLREDLEGRLAGGGWQLEA
jgi:hypothetical protein